MEIRKKNWPGYWQQRKLFPQSLANVPSIRNFQRIGTLPEASQVYWQGQRKAPIVFAQVSTQLAQRYYFLPVDDFQQYQSQVKFRDYPDSPTSQRPYQQVQWQQEESGWWNIQTTRQFHPYSEIPELVISWAGITNTAIITQGLTNVEITTAGITNLEIKW